MVKVFKKFLIDSLQIIVIGIVLFVLTNIFLGELLLVTGNSMHPILKNNEQIIGEKISLNLREPKRGEIVIFRHPQESILIIKRVVGLPEEKVRIENDQIFINGKILEEPYLENVDTRPGKTITEGKEHTIPEDHYLLLGDNRNESMDGRTWGFLPKENITSRALLVYYPFENFRLIRELSNPLN